MDNNGYDMDQNNNGQNNGYGTSQNNGYGTSQNNGYIQSPYQNQYGSSQQNFKPKKNGLKTVILIITIILLLCCGAIGVIGGVLFKAIKPKDEINIDNFISTMESMEYEWSTYEQDMYEFYSPDYNTYVAVDVSGDFSYETDFEGLVNELGYEDSSSKSNTSGSNYSTYSWRVDSDYMYACRIDETVIMICSNNKDTIEQIKDKTGL